MHDSRMSAAAAHRMRARPARRPALRPLTHEVSAQDRRRIPLEGLRKTEAWKAHQAFVRALERLEEQAEAYRERHRYSVTTLTDDFTDDASWITVTYVGANSNSTATTTARGW